MFYKVPDRVFAPLAEKEIVKGRVLVVNDLEDDLKTQIQDDGCEVYSCTLDDLLSEQYDPRISEIDWMLCVTQGLGKKAEWVIDSGLVLPKKGFCLLDRISFLEPTRSRQHLLLSDSLRNLIILSPRPAFRADNKQAKDSVTSAWFVFSATHANTNNTKIDFALNWHRPKTLCSG